MPNIAVMYLPIAVRGAPLLHGLIGDRMASVRSGLVALPLAVLTKLIEDRFRHKPVPGGTHVVIPGQVWVASCAKLSLERSDRIDRDEAVLSRVLDESPRVGAPRHIAADLPPCGPDKDMSV